MGGGKLGQGHDHCGGVANATINEALKPFYSFFAASLAALYRLHKISPSTIARTAALVSWWKNNSFTPEAIEADDYFYKLKSGQ